MKKKGQAIIEMMWVLLFVMSFLTSILFFYDQAEKEIQKIRKGEKAKYEKTNFFYSR